MEYIVIKPYESSNPDPIKLEKGDSVNVAERSDANGPWPNWIYCTSQKTGKAGWTPEQILTVCGNKAIANMAYDATELTIAPGDILQGSKILNGWIWCKRQSDGARGWAPLNCIQER